MSELIDLGNAHSRTRLRLLAGASVLALTVQLVSLEAIAAENADRPSVWIELGGRFDFLDHPTETWLPANLPPAIANPVSASANPTPHIGYDIDGEITIQPPGEDWKFVGAVQYGKAKRGPKLLHDQTYATQKTLSGKYALTTYAFTNLHAVEETKHLVVDFRVGRDVGLGLFGGHGNSTLSFGIRMAQFNVSATGSMDAQTNVPVRGSRGEIFDADMNTTRNFSGLGPSIDWTGSTPLSGTLDNGLAIDWGLNGAILFGRQKAKIHAHSGHRYYTGGYSYSATAYGGYNYHYNTIVRTNTTRGISRRKSVVVPNIGVFAGISYRVGGRGKVSLGYRADFFFGAMDGGIYTHKSENVGFHGPFATISLGLGG